MGFLKLYQHFCTLKMMTLNPHQLWTKCNINVKPEIWSVNLVV